MKVKLTAIIALIIMAVIFIVQNSAMVEVKIVFWTITISRILLMFIILILGIVIGFLLRSYIRHRRTVNRNKEINGA